MNINQENLKTENSTQPNQDKQSMKFKVSNLKYLFVLGQFLVSSISFSLSAQGFDHSHSEFDLILKKYVVNGFVKYKDLSKDRVALTQYLKSLSSLTANEYKDFNNAQKMAFLINAYNAFTIELILNNYPIKSIGDIGGPIRLVNLARGAPWKNYKFPLLGADRTLDWIEHSKLRIDFNDPRIHFAINCASIGCPALRKESYKAKNLDAQLQDSMLSFLNDKTKNSYNKEKGILTLSKIFDWFKSDFEKKSGTVIQFVQIGFQDTIPSDVDIEYSSYDWNLNETK